MSTEICRMPVLGNVLNQIQRPLGDAAGYAAGGIRLTCRAWLLSCRMNSTFMPRAGGMQSSQSCFWNSRRWPVAVIMTPLSRNSLKTSIWPFIKSSFGLFDMERTLGNRGDR